MFFIKSHIIHIPSSLILEAKDSLMEMHGVFDPASMSLYGLVLADQYLTIAAVFVTFLYLGILGLFL